MKILNTAANRWLLLALTLMTFIAAPLIADAKGSFGGSRGGGGRSFGGSRGGGSSFGSSRGSSSRSNSYTRPSAPAPSYNRTAPSTSPSRSYSSPRSSFGGSRSGSSEGYRRSYGIPRQSTPMTVPNGQGGSQNYIVHNYGGRGDGFMMGYMMGSTPFLWHTPFHPAYYYSRPTYVTNPDGTVEVYPPTFSFMTLFFTLVVAGGVVLIIVMIVRRRRSAFDSNSSFD
ncbi:MAG: hypothetical protein U0264_01020 [Candidatus Kapaibacterium sp.]